MSIAFEKVNYTYNQGSPFEFAALKDININIQKGSFTALIGHTGSGKSTLIQHINALLLPSSGKIDVEGFILSNKKDKHLKELRKKVGMVFQFPEAQLFEETVLKDIIYGPLNFGMDEAQAVSNAKECLELVGLDESYLERSPFELSGGQKRRVAIAGILVMQPEILILDEPTAGLDPMGSKEMMDLFKKINASGVTVIMVTHDMNNVLEYCDQAIVMDHGQVVKNTTVAELFNDESFLKDHAIDLPNITKFIMTLNKNGINIDTSIKSIDTLVEVIGGMK